VAIIGREASRATLPKRRGAREPLAAFAERAARRMVIMRNEPTFWFPTKRYGWGWGLPVRWQGWVVLVVYVALVLGGRRFLGGPGEAPLFLVYLLVVTAALIAIIALKGERPVRWRWGKK
jgi:hypothetical protein